MKDESVSIFEKVTKSFFSFLLFNKINLYYLSANRYHAPVMNSRCIQHFKRS